ncbi:MAG: hypothetical protein R3272_15140 [Candidatus Promineifilaceae bacterium]|nr:hypothetical protein [Candidatus Promineifilaceae bacterium]
MTTTTVTVPPMGMTRRIAFYLTTLLGALGILAFFSLVAPVYSYGVQAWINPSTVGSHVVHSMLDSSLLALPVIALLLQLHRPQETAAGVQAAMLVMGVALLITLFTLPMFAPLMAIFFVVSALVGALHPARREVFGLHGPVNLGAAALAAAALLVMLPFISDHLRLQGMALAGEEHAELGHWAISGAFALVVPLLALLGSFSNAGWRIPAVSAAVLAVLFGTGSLLHPGAASSLGVAGGVIAIVWAALYLAVNFLRRE